MMIFIIFTILTVLPNGIKCNENVTNSVIYENKTEMGALSKTIELSCPILVTELNLSVIIWNFDTIKIPVPVNQKSNDVTSRIRAGNNGSLLIERLQYDDAKIYTCEGYTTTLIYSININLIVNGPPNNFQSFSYNAMSDSSIEFYWKINFTNTNFIQGYNLTLCKSLIIKECTTVSFSHPKHSYVFKSLKPYSDYYALIIAFNNIGTNNQSDIKARTSPGIPLARPYLSSKNVTARNVTLKIECYDCSNTEKMRGIFKYFTINYKDRGSNLNKKLLTNLSKIESTITHLQPYSKYTFFVSASNGVKSGPEDQISCSTKEDIPNSTRYLRTTEITSSEIEVKWDPASDSYGQIIGYTLKVTENNQFNRNEMLFEIEPTTHQFRLTGLKPRNPYSIGLAARNRAGLSDFVNTMAKTDRAAPSPPKLNYIKFIQNFIRVVWKNQFPLNDTSTLYYTICWTPVTDLNIDNKCYKMSSTGEGKLRCMCQTNSTIHSVDIPTSFVNLNFSKVNFWVRVKVASEICESCGYLEATSEEFTLDVNGFQISTRKTSSSSFTYTIIILLTVGFIIFFAGFFAIFCFCGNRNCKQLFLQNRSNGHYSRPSREYIEVFPRPVSPPKMLPLDKNPYPPIQVKDLVDHIMDYRCDGGAGFQTEFEAIEMMDTSRWSITYPNIKENKIKNRYTNIFPYDHSRVILQNTSTAKSDYINASFVDGYNRHNAYIATQGPLPETIVDFWQMVYEQNSEIIVMISNFEERGRRKCEVYWIPNKVACYGNIAVRQIYHKKMAFYTERRFGIKNIRNKKNANKERTVYHYQYTDWRDFDVPPSSLPVLVFVKATIKHWSKNSGPIIVHCSAGVGRTGTYICIESEIRQMEAEHRINVRGFLEHIRQQRMKLVQTESQYTFIYDALYEYYLCPDHEIHKDILLSYISQLNFVDFNGFTKLEEQFQMCIQYEPTNYEYIECKRSYNLSKNRSKILPIDSRRINICCEPGIEGSNYINASAIQGYWEMKEFIVTQHPLEETEPDLWKMVWDENCTIIILLSNENLPQFWPAHENEFRTYRWSRVNYCNSEDSGNVSQHGFLLSSPREDYALDCTMHRLKHWPTDVSETADLLRLLFKVNSDKEHSPIIVIDDFGGSKAGIFVALSSLLNQLRNDEVVDVYFIMKMIHMERPHTFSSSEDLKFVYNLIEHVIINQSSYPFFTNPPPTFIPNGVCHQPSIAKTNLNNSSFISQYATLNTLRSKSSSTSTSRRRASSAESEPFNSSNQSPVKSRGPHNRISWNPGETRYSSITDSFMDWSTSVGNGHYNNAVSIPSNVQIISNPIIEILPNSTKIISHYKVGQNNNENITQNNVAMITDTSDLSSDV